MQWCSQDNTCMYGRVHTAMQMQDLYEIEKDPPGEGAGGVVPS